MAIKLTKLRPHPLQAKLMRCKARHVAVVCGRQSGKTDIARRKILKEMAKYEKGKELKKYIYAVPTRDQAKRLVWEEFKKIINKKRIKKISESELFIWLMYPKMNEKGELVNYHESILYIMGMDKPHRVEGLSIDGAVIDESSDIKPGTYEASIRPTLIATKGWIWMIGVPKINGIGGSEYKEFYEKGVNGCPGYESFNWTSASVWPEEAEEAKSECDPKTYNEMYNATWETMGGNVYYQFSAENIKEHKYDENLPLIISFDYNVDPYTGIFAQEINGQTFIFDELFMRDCNTLKALEYCYRKFSQHKGGFIFYGDSTNNKRSTNSVNVDDTDRKFIYNDKNFEPKKINYRTNPNRKVRIDSLNTKICNTKGERNLFISKNCKNLIKEIMSLSYKDNTNDINSLGNQVGHITDALGYYVWYNWPIKYNITPTAGIVSFIGYN